MSERIIEAERSIIWAADLEPHRFKSIVAGLGNLAGLGAVKIGFELGLGIGLSEASDAVRDADEDLSVIYDHQKAATDIPDTGENFARTMKNGGVDAAILFPFTGPRVLDAWTKALQDNGIGVIVGAEMTHPQMKASEHGYINDSAFLRIFDQAVELGVRDFVVPGNKPERVALYREAFDKVLGAERVDFYAPGFVAQGGSISESAEVAGDNWHAIVGRGISGAKNPREAIENYAREII